MSDETDFTDDAEGNGIKDLRKKYEAEKKSRGELEARLAVFEKAQRVDTLADVFKAKGLDEAKAKAAAKLYNGDDVSEDAAGKWLADYADLFPVAQTTEPDANTLNAARVAAASHGSADSGVAGNSNALLGDPFEIQRLFDTLPHAELVKLGLIPA